MSFSVKIPLFEGPFDLLLFFIEKNELDIYDIPIAKITEEFLAYSAQLEKMNIEVASEFIVVAATLMRIKMKMLLPRPQLEEGGKEIDPRDELVRHLLEYKKYKSVMSELATLEDKRLEKEKRGNIVAELKKIADQTKVEIELQSITLYQLLSVYEKVIARHQLEKNKTLYTVTPYPYTIEAQKHKLIEKLVQTSQISFKELIQNTTEKMAVLFNFLAILELIQLRQITIRIGLGYNNFWIQRSTEPLEA